MKNLLKFSAFIFIILFSLSLFAKTGDLKIFSEIKGIDIYLDDVFQGTDKILMENIPTGTHYLKITKSKVVLFSEIIEIRENQTASILIKDSKEIQQKISAAVNEEINLTMKDEIEQYKSKRLVIFSTQSPSGSVDWFVKHGGIRLSDAQFASLVGDASTLQKIQSSKRTAAVMTCIGVPFIVAGAVIYVMAIVKGVQEQPLFPGMSTDAGQVVLNILFGAIPLGTGVGLTVSGNSGSRPYSMESALKLVTDYNTEIKKSLGLPADFELKE